MDVGEVAIVAGIAAAVSGSLGWLIPSPKDRQREREQSITGRLSAIEIEQRTTDRAVVALTTKVDFLGKQIAELAAAVRELSRHVTR